MEDIIWSINNKDNIIILDLLWDGEDVEENGLEIANILASEYEADIH